MLDSRLLQVRIKWKIPTSSSRGIVKSKLLHTLVTISSELLSGPMKPSCSLIVWGCCSWSVLVLTVEASDGRVLGLWRGFRV